MQLTGESINSKQLLAWSQELFLVLTNITLEVFQKICIRDFFFSQTNIQLFYRCKQFFLESQFPLTFKLSLVLISSKTNRVFQVVFLRKLKNKHQCFEVVITPFRALFSSYEKSGPLPWPYYLCFQVSLETLDGVQNVFALQHEVKNLCKAFTPRGWKRLKWLRNLQTLSKFYTCIS